MPEQATDDTGVVKGIEVRRHGARLVAFEFGS
jgi:hypothetical protein